MRMKRFLAATDGSRDGEHAVAIAATLAQRTGGELGRIEVEEITPAWEPQLEWWKEPACPNGTATRLRGLPGIEIVRHADEWDADLVVLGRHSRSTEGPFTLGMTPDTVIRRRTGPSLFAPPETQAFNRVLIAVDGSPRGLRVLESVDPLLDIMRATVYAICVLPGKAGEEADAFDLRDPRIERVRRDTDRLDFATGPCNLLVRKGEPVTQILKALRVMHADLLVLGVRRGGAPGDLGSGHIGRDLLQAAPCAVLTVPI